MKDSQWSRFIEHLLTHAQGEMFRISLQEKSEKLIAMMTGGTTSTNQLVQLGIQQAPSVSPADRAEIQYWAIRFTAILVKKCPGWIAGQQQLVETIRGIWCNETVYQEKHRKGDQVDYTHWKEPKLIVKIMLEFFKHHIDTHISLLFDCLRALCGRFLTDFQFLKDFLETEVSMKYSVEWKRAAFFEFVRLWRQPEPNSELTQDLRARILQYILIPCFAWSFDHGEGDRLIGSPPAPDLDNEANVVSAFILNIIDPESPFGTSDNVRILLLQFSCLLVDQGADHIHDASNKKQERIYELVLMPRECCRLHVSLGIMYNLFYMFLFHLLLLVLKLVYINILQLKMLVIFFYNSLSQCKTCCLAINSCSGTFK